jgi:hypothetical protein
VATQLSQIDTHLNDVLERAGVEPSPWMPGLNGDIGKLNAMANHLGIIYDRLDAVLVTPPDPWMPEFHEALGNLHGLASGISERASNPPDPYRESPEAMAALEAVRNAAQAIVDLVDCFFGPSV